MLQWKQEAIHGWWSWAPRLVLSLGLASGAHAQPVNDIARTLGPLVRMVEPASDQVFHASDLIRMQADALDPDGAVRNLEFYVRASGEPMVLRAVKPFHADIRLPPGRYEVFASAVDNGGARAETTPVRFVVRPDNDDFSRRTPLSGSPLEIPFTTDEATAEPGAPGNDHQSVWWSWKPAYAGNVTVVLEGTVRSADVFLGGELGRLEALVVSDSFSGQPRQLAFRAEVGLDYTFRSSGGSRLRIVRGSPPTVDFVETSKGSPYFLGDTLTLRCEARDPENAVREVTVFQDPPGREIHRATNPNGIFEISVPLTTLGHLRLKALAIDEDGLTGMSSELVISPLWPAPANDAFTNALPIIGAPVRTSGIVFGATSEPGDPLGDSAWWFWTPSTSGVYTVTVLSPSSPYFQVFEGSELSHLRSFGPPEWIGDSSQPGRRKTFVAEQGIPYALGVLDHIYPGETEISIVPGAPPRGWWGRVRSTGIVPEGVRVSVEVEAIDPDNDLDKVELYDSTGLIATLRPPLFRTIVTVKRSEGKESDWANLSAVAFDSQGLLNPLSPLRVWADTRLIPNDDFADRMRISGAPVTLAAPLQGGTGEAERRDLGRLVWWEWTPSVSGPHTIAMRQHAGFYRFLSFEGTDLSNVIMQKEHALDCPTTFNAQAGHPYIFAMDGNGEARVEILPSAPPTVDLISPTGGVTYREGEPIRVVAEALDDGRISRVDVTFDHVQVGSMTRPPFSMEFHAPIPVFVGELLVVAFDDQGIPSCQVRKYLNVIPTRPVNDDFLNRTKIEGAVLTATGSIGGSSLESFESQESGRGSVWWTWRAPRSGTAWTMVSFTRGPLNLEVFSGDDPLRLVRVGAAADDGFHTPPVQLQFYAVSGVRYQIRCVGNVTYGPELQLSIVLDASGRPSIRRQVDGTLQIGFSDSLERLWQVEASEDLSSWTNWGEIRSKSGFLRLESRAPFESPRLFYRFSKH